MNYEKNDSTIKPILPEKPVVSQGDRSTQNTGAKNVDPQRHPEKANVGSKTFVADKNKRGSL